MKLIFIALLLSAIFCEEYHTYHYEGKMAVNSDPLVAINGPIYIELLKTMNVTIISGMHTKGSVNTPFGFVAKITKIIMNGNKMEIEVKCWEGGWGHQMVNDLVGMIRITGDLNQIEFMQNCTEPKSKMQVGINAHGVKAQCPFYLPPEAAKRAQILVGEKEEMYKPIHVLNFAVMGYPYIESIKDCSWWLKNFHNATEGKPGFVVVGTDGKHCGIVDKEGDKFIHSNPVKHLVTATPMAMLKDFFKAGHVFKEYKC